jgi:DeoR family fructose operon transcriptional repressor
MQPEERQHRIEEYLNKVEFASLEELSREVQASQSTIRRDLTALESLGNIRRTHGGARLASPRSDEFVFTARDTHQLAEKEAIGRACASLIEPGRTLILDAGTTVYHVARNLASKRHQVITNSLPVANFFAADTSVEAVVSGGVIYPRLGVLVGPLAVESFTKMHADIAVLGAGGLTLEGVTNSHALLIDIQRAMLHSAHRVILCLDHTKFNRKSIAFLCGLDRIHTLVTDTQAPADLLEVLQSRGIQVVLAPVN